MNFHKDVKIHRAFVSLFDAICSWERNTGRKSTLLFVPLETDEETLLIVDGKPVSFTPLLLQMQLDLIKSRIIPDKTEKRYRCISCGNIFYAEDPPLTIPTSVVFCPSCDGLAERAEIWDEIWAKKPLTDKFDQVFLKDEDAYWKKEMDKWLEKEVIPFIKGLEVKAEKLDAIEALMRGQSFIHINVNDQYSIQPRLGHKGTEIVSEIMAILIPDDEPEAICSAQDQDECKECTLDECPFGVERDKS
jgi:hypothetical protein